MDSEAACLFLDSEEILFLDLNVDLHLTIIAVVSSDMVYDH